MAKTPMFTISVEGSTVTARSAHGDSVSIDATKLPQAQRDAALVQGTASMLRVAYANAENAADGLRLLRERAAGLMSGKWLPGTRSAAPKEPDDLALAVMEVTKRDLAHYENVFLPNWLAEAAYTNGTKIVSLTNTSDGKTRMKGKAEALKALAAHHQVAPILARIAAERAKAHRGDKQPLLTAFVGNASGASAEAAE